MAQTETNGLGSFDMANFARFQQLNGAQFSPSDRLPTAPATAPAGAKPDAAVKLPTVEVTPSPPNPSNSSGAQDGNYYHSVSKGDQNRGTTQADQASTAQGPGLLPRTGPADPYYHGVIPRTRILDSVGNVADVALPALTGVVANSYVRHVYERNFYAASVTGAEQAQNVGAAHRLQVAIRQAHQPELDGLTRQMRNIARQTGVNPAEDTTWLQIRDEALTANERNIAARWRDLRFPATDAAAVDRAVQATADPAIKNLVRTRAEEFGAANTLLHTRLDAAETLANAMRTGSIAALGIGELANFGIDRTIYKNTPHSLRTTLFDVAAPAVVLSRLPWQAKLAAIVGTHLVNRYTDSRTPNVGDF